MKTLFKKNENVTVLKFAEHFSSGMIHETMIELSKKQAAKTAFCDCIAIKIPSKEVDDSVRIGLVLVKEGAYPSVGGDAGEDAWTFDYEFEVKDDVVNRVGDGATPFVATAKK